MALEMSSASTLHTASTLAAAAGEDCFTRKTPGLALID
jgi:hypothetical protein